jgi:hypothetical protein
MFYRVLEQVLVILISSEMAEVVEGVSPMPVKVFHQI